MKQDKKFCGEQSTLEVGEDCVIREHVTIHSGTQVKTPLEILKNMVELSST